MLELASIPLTMGPVLLLAIVHFLLRKTLGASIPLLLGSVFSQVECGGPHRVVEKVSKPY